MSEEGIKKAEGMLDVSERKAASRRVDITHVSGKKSGRHYAFISENKSDTMKAKMEGYSPVKQAENLEMEVPAADLIDGCFHLGDTVLMEIPQELKDRLHEDDVRSKDAVIGRIKGEFREEIGKAAKEAGVERDLVIEDNANTIGEAEERQRAQVKGRVQVAVGAGIDKQGNVVK